MAEFDPEIVARVEEISAQARESRLMLATAESCTGGLIAASITSLAGSSTVFDRGVVTYSNEAKNELLGVPTDILDHHGAVSAETADAMVTGLFACSRGDLGVSVTGVAGPGGGSAEKPVGLVYIGHGQRHGAVTASRYIFEGDREAIRRQTVLEALSLFHKMLSGA